MAEPMKDTVEPGPRPESAVERPVKCEICGTFRRPADSILCRVCGEPVLVWGWAP
jgi:ribosomal protein S27E